jgi:ribonuclease HI
MNIINIFADGSCLGNPGPGGWAAIIRDENGEVEYKGGEENTTNNRMEMTALLESLKVLKRKGVADSVIRFHTDSSLVINTFTRNWKKKANVDIWMQIEKAYMHLKGSGNTFEWKWVKGHAGHKENERCDVLARSEAEKR